MTAGRPPDEDRSALEWLLVLSLLVFMIVLGACPE